MKFSSAKCAFPGLCMLLSALLLGPALAQNTTANEGGDLVVGGSGTAPGKFLELRDITFDAQGNLFTLDGVKIDTKRKLREGNLRVQKFTNDGKLLASFSIADPELGDKEDPQRIAVDASGNTYITQPGADLVQEYAPDGKKLRDIALPRAMAITTWKHNGRERIAIVPSRRDVIQNKGWTWMGGDRIIVLSPDGQVESSIPLEKQLEHVIDITADREGNFYIQAEPNAIYKVSPDGKPLRIYGGNPTTRAEDGSEVLHTVAVDSKGNVYTMTWGNPGMVTRFDRNGLTVTQRGGQFKWADPWSPAANYTVLAIDPNDRLWAADTQRHSPDYVHLKTQRDVPAVIRAQSDFFANPVGSIRITPVRMLGFKPNVTCGLPYNVSYEPGKPVPMTFSVGAANRFVARVDVSWRVLDVFKNEVARGAFHVPLENGKEAGASFTFTPARYGSYFVLTQIDSAKGEMGAVGEHVGVTPHFANMPVLKAGESPGGWTDAPRQMWAGLPMMRIHPAKLEKDLPQTDAQIALAEKVGATYIVQLVAGMKDLTAEYVRRIATRYKGRVNYYEVCNEPNFSSNVEDYFKGHKMAYDLIKEIDPHAQVMGPATVNMNLDWLKRLYALGFKSVTDIVSTHDYEGHESVTPEHWIWKYSQMRQIMAANGDAAKPIWQTERAISGVRGKNFQGLVQAIRCTLHRDLWETFGVPSEHNSLYYLNQGGYSAVPSYVWSVNGPHPAALALRTRHALTSALGRSYSGTLDFGPTGNTFLMGVRYHGPNGTTVALRNLGTRATPLAFGVKGATSLNLVDSWGNQSTVSVHGGKARLVLEQLPVYVQLSPGQDLVAPRLDFGKSISSMAKLSYSTTFKGDYSLLTNGVYETYHDKNPNGDTNGAQIWTGDLPLNADGTAIPKTLELRFDRPQTIDKVIVRGVRGDNAFCALLDYDLEYFDGAQWKTIETVHNAMPSSEVAQTADSTHAIWMDDTNLYVHQFAAVKAERVRLVARRASFGYVPDDRALAWGHQIPPKLMLRELEIYAVPQKTRR